MTPRACLLRRYCITGLSACPSCCSKYRSTASTAEQHRTTTHVRHVSLVNNLNPALVVTPTLGRQNKVVIRKVRPALAVLFVDLVTLALPVVTAIKRQLCAVVRQARSEMAVVFVNVVRPAFTVVPALKLEARFCRLVHQLPYFSVFLWTFPRSQRDGSASMRAASKTTSGPAGSPRPNCPLRICLYRNLIGTGAHRTRAHGCSEVTGRFPHVHGASTGSLMQTCNETTRD